MNQMRTTSPSFAPASCPLLAAVLPVRYAIGPLRSPASASAISAAALQIPGISGSFPELGPDHPQLSEYRLGYVPRMLRDGWLYVWQDSLGQLIEYQVAGSLLKPTSRGEPALAGEARAYLILPAGAPAQLAWSPVRWNDAKFASLCKETSLRQTTMREIVPGVAPLSGPAASTLSELGDHNPENYRWSCAPKPQAWPLQVSVLRQMKRCEQQFHAVVDDPWGILLDLAGLLNARKEAFERFARVRADEWATASTVKTVSENDARIRSQLGSLIDVTRLEQTLREQERAMDEHDADARRITGFWTDWFATFGEEGPATLESACENFDISQPDTRDILEASFAAAFLGPATTSLGVKAIERALDLQSGSGEPWLLWAMLGVTRRIGPGELKQLLDMPDNLASVSGDLAKEATKLGRVAVLVTALNQGADKIANLQPRGGGEPLFAALSPILAGRLRSLSEQIHSQAYKLVIAMLARSQQHLKVESFSVEETLRVLNEQMSSAHNKGQRRSVEKRAKQTEHQKVRASQVRAGSSMPLNPISQHLREAIPHLRVIPRPQPAPPHPQPGYGSTAPHAAINKPATALPSLAKVGGGGLQIPSISELLNEAPLKTLIAIVALWNAYRVSEVWSQKRDTKNDIALASAGLSVATAGTAILQQLAETNWQRHISRAGHTNPEA